MNRRICKKHAKKYINGLLSGNLYLPFGFREEEYRVYNDGTPPVIKTIANFPWRITREVWQYARRKYGWDGCHWTDPLLLAVDDTAQTEYEELYHPPHTW